MGGPRRRRRFDDEPSGGMPLFPLVLVVILAGLLLGGALAHFFGGKGTPRVAPTEIVALPSPPVTAAPIVTARLTPSSSPSRSLAPSPRPSAPSTVRPTPKTRASSITSPTPAGLNVRTPALRTQSPKRPTLVATAAPSVLTSPSPGVESRSSAIVRSYLDALARGDRAEASSYLAHGTPSETFMNAESHIESIRSATIGDRQYRVTADVQTTSGEYYVTFTVENGPLGLQITDHYSIKPQ